MIYGAYMHVVQDLYAHMTLQPSLFGYPKVIESDSALSDGLLFYPECYYEALAATYIPNWDFIADLYLGMDENWEFTFISPYSFYTKRDIDLATGEYVYHHWQDPGTNTTPIEKFVEAAQAEAVGYDSTGLTWERLRAYMHGWGVLLYTMYGLNESDGSFGGPFSHPLWTPGDIIRFIGSNFAKCVTVDNVAITGDAGHVGDYIVDFIGSGILLNFYKTIFNDPFLNKTVDNLKMLFIQRIASLAEGSEQYNHPWPWYLETTNGLDMAIGDWSNDSIAVPYFHKLRRELEYWENYAQPPIPSTKEFYEGEIGRIIELTELYKKSVDSGAVYLDYSGHTGIAKKSGILGGMYEVDLTKDYYKQPGVLDMHFEQSEEYIYTETPISIEGDPTYIDLKYDLVTFGPTRVYIFGKKADNSDVELTLIELPGPSRETSTLSVNAKDAINQGIRELSFRVETQAKTGLPDFWPMFNSNYRDAYNSHWEINGNPYYQTLFKEGNPVRVEGEDPLANPEDYWPYVLPITPFVSSLNAPTNSGCDAVSDHYIKVHWQDNSNYETEYIIERKSGDEGVWEVIGSTGDPDLEIWEDYYVIYGNKYWYRVSAYNDVSGVYSIYSDSVHDYAIPIWSDDDGALASNNGRKIAVTPDGTICVVYVSQNRIWYTESSDGGNTWSEDVCIAEPFLDRCCYPATTCDEVGRRIIVWEDRQEEIPEGGSRYAEIHYCCIDPQTGDTIKTTESISAYSEEYPTVVAYNDSVYVAFVTSDRNIGGYIRPGCYCDFLSFPYDSPPFFEFQQQIDYAQLGCQNPTLVKTQDGSLHVVYERTVYGGYRDRNYLVSKRYDGNDWVDMKQIYETVSSGCPPPYYPSVTSNNNELYLSWSFREDTVYYSHFDGSSWSTPDIIASGTVGSPSIATGENHTVVTWKEDEDIYYSVLENDVWTEPVNRSNSPKDSKSPHIVTVAESGTFKIGWVECENNPPHSIKIRTIYGVSGFPSSIPGMV